MDAPSRAGSESRRSRAWLWAAIPIALGSLILIGATIAGAIIALRPGALGSLLRRTPAPSSPASPTIPKSTVPTEPAQPEASDSSEPNDGDSELVSVPAPAAGARTLPEEAKALLPVSPGMPIWGVADALATLSVFGDLDCPHTRASLRSALRLAAKLGPRLRLVFYERPLEGRATAAEAAIVLARTAQQSGSDVAWRVLARAANAREAASSDELARWLASAGAPAPASNGLEDPAARRRVEDDTRLAAALDVRETPTLFVNGRRIIGAEPDAVLERAIEDEVRSVRWLRAQGLGAEATYTKRIRKNVIGVEGDAPDRFCVPADAAPASGPRDALITIVEFSDFECDHCRSLEPALASVIARHPGAVRRVWRSFALPQHSRARALAGFALAARALGGDAAFWAVHDALFAASPEELDDAHLVQLASRLGFDGERLLAAASDSARRRALDVDQELAESLSLTGAPTVFINGRELAGAAPPQVLEVILRQELEAARRIARGGTAPARFESLLCGG